MRTHMILMYTFATKIMDSATISQKIWGTSQYKQRYPQVLGFPC